MARQDREMEGMTRLGAPEIRYDGDADVLYIRISDQPAARSQELDDYRLIDLSQDGDIVGFEFVDARAVGVDLSNIDPQSGKTIEQLVTKAALPIKVYA